MSFGASVVQSSKRSPPTTEVRVRVDHEEAEGIHTTKFVKNLIINKDNLTFIFKPAE